jgi:hypothetical protein
MPKCLHGADTLENAERKKKNFVFLVVFIRQRLINIFAMIANLMKANGRREIFELEIRNLHP